MNTLIKTKEQLVDYMLDGMFYGVLEVVQEVKELLLSDMELEDMSSEDHIRILGMINKYLDKVEIDE